MEATHQKLFEENQISTVSVIIPTYRHGELVRSTLGSVLEQDYPLVEIIVCDDASEDFDAEGLLALGKAKESYKLTVIHHEKNLGTVGNLNSALSLSTGEWVMVLAGDDVLASSTVISQLVECGVSKESDWVLGSTVVCGADLKPRARLFPREEHLEMLSDAHSAYLALCTDCFIPSSGSLYKRDFLHQHGAFDSKYRLVEDLPLFLKATRLGQTPSVCDIPAVLRREGGTSGGGAGKNKIYQSDLIQVIDCEIIPHLSELSKKEQEKLLRFCKDKRAVFQFRFGGLGIFGKALWALTHIGLIFRKLFSKK